MILSADRTKLLHTVVEKFVRSAVGNKYNSFWDSIANGLSPAPISSEPLRLFPGVSVTSKDEHTTIPPLSTTVSTVLAANTPVSASSPSTAIPSTAIATSPDATTTEPQIVRVLDRHREKKQYVYRIVWSYAGTERQTQEVETDLLLQNKVVQEWNSCHPKRPYGLAARKSPITNSPDSKKPKL